MAFYHGDASNLTPIEGANFYYEDGALGVLQQSYEIRKDLAFSKSPAHGAAHPVFSQFTHDKRRMTMRFEAATAVLTCSYLSNQIPGSGAPFQLEPIYELVGSLSTEPIDTHPNFVSSLGGTKAAPLNKAIFDKDGRFTGFPPDATAGLGGVRTFLSPNLTWRQTTFSGSSVIAGITALGRIDSPQGPAPSLGGSKNWLLVGFTQRRQGTQYQTSREWRSSGPRGFNSAIYS